MKDLKNTAVCAAWIAGLLLAGWLLWLFTEAPRNRELAARVNRILAARGEALVLGGVPVKNGLTLGAEFVLEAPAEGTFLVFPLVSGGDFLSCGALIGPQGRVERLIPLGAHGEQIFDRVPAGILRAYIRRLESRRLSSRRSGGGNDHAP